jgi:glycosyltransferase involved in cell wall biosynthesis
MINHLPLVSIVITTFNHAAFIQKAITSALGQTYTNLEVLVIDDGSTDKTKEVVEQYASVKYHYQHNQGLSSARNTGIDQSNGEYILFLDADDWLYERAVEHNLMHLQSNSSYAFACGAHDMVDVEGKLIFESYPESKTNVYSHLLLRNYLAMHAAALFKRSIMISFRYDTNLRACEDYDLYFRITRSFPVVIHDQKIAAYRRHENNMSLNAPLMLHSVLKVLEQQKHILADEEEKINFRIGRQNWIKYYVHVLYTNKIKTKGIASLTKAERSMAFRYISILVEIWLREKVSGKH